MHVVHREPLDEKLQVLLAVRFTTKKADVVALLENVARLPVLCGTGGQADTALSRSVGELRLDRSDLLLGGTHTADHSRVDRRGHGTSTGAIMVIVSSSPTGILLGCVKGKVEHPAAAKDLYLLPLWPRRRAYAEASALPWMILSAQHGLVDPNTRLRPSTWL